MGIEHIKELVHESIRNVQEDDPSLLSSGRVKLVGELCTPHACPLLGTPVGSDTLTPTLILGGIT